MNVNLNVNVNVSVSVNVDVNVNGCNEISACWLCYSREVATKLMTSKPALECFEVSACLPLQYSRKLVCLTAKDCMLVF